MIKLDHSFNDLKYIALPVLPINLFGFYEIITNLDKIQIGSIPFILGSIIGSTVGFYFLYKIIERRMLESEKQ